MNLSLRRTCKANNHRGEACRQAPLADKEFCFWHDPENEQDRQQARHLGGLNRKREATLAEVYDLGGLDTVAALRRFLEVAMYATLGLDNGVQRNRTIIAAVTAAARLLEVGELEARIEAIEAVMEPEVRRKAERLRQKRR
jgi:hypothetical protein